MAKSIIDHFERVYVCHANGQRNVLACNSGQFAVEKLIEPTPVPDAGQRIDPLFAVGVDKRIQESELRGFQYTVVYSQLYRSSEVLERFFILFG